MPPMFRDAAVMVKLIHVLATMVWFPGTVSVGGIRPGRLITTDWELVVVCDGDDESVTVSLTVKDPTPA